MSTVELKSNIHKLIDGIDDEQLLQAYYDFLKYKSSNETGKLYNTLTNLQKEELLLAIEESEDESKWIDAREVLKNFRS